MWLWILGIIVVTVLTGVLTLLWWRVGDMWADAEHKRFGPRRDDAAHDGDGPAVIRGFDREPDADGRNGEARP